MSDRPMLVNETWLQKVQNAVFSSDGATKTPGAASLFYDVRPAVLASSWSANTAGVYAATAQFLVNDVVDASFTFPVYAPTATSDPGGTAGSTRFFVVWRGRWEMLAEETEELTGAEILEKLNITSANALTSAVPGLITLTYATGFKSIPVTPTGTITLTRSEDSSSGSIPFVNNIQAIDGVLGVQYYYLTATFTGDQTYIEPVAITESRDVATKITTAKTSFITAITAK